MHAQPQEPDNRPDLWADDTDDTDNMAADPANILEARELRDGVNLLGMPIDTNTH